MPHIPRNDHPMRVTEEQLHDLARLAAIAIAPGHVPGVIRNLELLLIQSSLLFDDPIDALVEPAPVYRP